MALESTIISHGMPYPRNVEMAREVEQIVRDGGATPATIAILDGVARIGLSADELELLATHEDVAKVSIRDLPHVMATKRHGATTVASTMRLAALAGIRVFVTGGLGGVHRGAEDSMDVSADLTELSQTDVAVVSAGVKSILDIGRTLEVLETLGVPVVTFGADEFPSFYSRSSGFTSPMRSDTVEELAEMMRVKWDLGLRGGIAVTNPVPAEDEMAPDGDLGPHRPGRRRVRRARHHRQGHHPLPPRPDRRALRRREPRDQHRARAQQRPPRRRPRPRLRGSGTVLNRAPGIRVGFLRRWRERRTPSSGAQPCERPWSGSAPLVTPGRSGRAAGYAGMRVGRTGHRRGTG